VGGVGGWVGGLGVGGRPHPPHPPTPKTPIPNPHFKGIIIFFKIKFLKLKFRIKKCQ